ncbi:hypothetical protein [Leptospira stimsonii]|uniref:Uncharacterized protein n=1 Tax=Leptospira stimsonii TaxID=2202203 RepID=A0ABY2MWC0_9LEPT|nr:hypothetical protein [Leptospira stimsonii]TGK23403.1 hypothetical protein EHO98_05165 [Leptospira stimsonii]TGM10079.1 hypothetical protein EHQ90_19255 [Leptospira stimsonii]
MKRPLTGHINCFSEDGDGLYCGPRIAEEVRDTMILGRCKHGYHGGYPAGFLERARLLLVGGDQDASIWHIPGGKAKEYNGIRGGVYLTGFGKNDKTIDLDQKCNPDFCIDVRKLEEHFLLQEDGNLTFVPFPDQDLFYNTTKESSFVQNLKRPKSIIIDRPYDEENADRYVPGRSALPNLNKLLIDCLNLVDRGSLVGVLDYKWPNPSPSIQFEEVSVYAVGTGRGSTARWFTIWRKR